MKGPVQLRQSKLEMFFREKLMSLPYQFPSLLLCFSCILTHLFHCPNLWSVDILF